MNLDLDKSNWRRVRLGEVVARSKVQMAPSRDGINRYVAGGHFDEGKLVVERSGDMDDGAMGSTFKYVFRPGHVLFVSASMYLRKVGVAQFTGVVADKTYVLESIPLAGLLQDFLPWVLLSDRFFEFSVSQATGSMNARLLWSTMQSFEFDLPPLDEQQRIADLLWAAETHRRDATALVDFSKSAANTAFDEALSAGHSNGWPASPITELVTVGPTNGKSAPANDQQRGIPTLSISAVRDGRILGGAAVKYVEIDRSAVERFMLVDGDFLVVRGNGNKQLTALGGMVRGALPNDCFYPDLLIRLRFDEQVIRPDFAARQWNAPRAHGALLRRAKSTNGIWKINGNDIKSHRLVVPPLDAQDVLLARVEAMENARQSAQLALSNINNLKTALINEVFE